MTGIRLLIATTLLVIALFSPLQASAADHFHVLPLASADNEKIAALLQPLAAKWLPAEELAPYLGLYWQKSCRNNPFVSIPARKDWKMSTSCRFRQITETACSHRNSGRSVFLY